MWSIATNGLRTTQERDDEARRRRDATPSTTLLAFERLQQEARQASREMRAGATGSGDLETSGLEPMTVSSVSLREVLESREQQPLATMPPRGAEIAITSRIETRHRHSHHTPTPASPPLQPLPNLPHRHPSTRAQVGPPRRETANPATDQAVQNAQARPREQGELASLQEQIDRAVEHAREVAGRVWEAEMEVVRAEVRVRNAERDVQEAREALEVFDREGEGEF